MAKHILRNLFYKKELATSRIVSQLVTRTYCTAFENTDDFFNEYPSVYTTGITFKTNSGETIGRIGTYWGRGDPLNTFKPFADGNVNMARTQIEAVSFALKQAIYEKKAEGVFVKTDSEYVERIVNRYLQYWRPNNFHKSDGTKVKNRQEIEELDRLLQSIDAKVQYVTFESDRKNVLLSHLKEEGVMTENLDQLKAGVSQPIENELSNYTADTDDDTPVPVIYTTASRSKSGNNGFFVAGYGIYWPDHSDADRSERYAELPITLYRAQLAAIISALEEAIKKGLHRVEIATDSPIFLGHYKAKWLKLNGSPIANYPLYKQIVNLSGKIQVKFKYVPESLGDENMSKAKELAVNGMAYPIIKNSKIAKFPAELA